MKIAGRNAAPPLPEPLGLDVKRRVALTLLTGLAFLLMWKTGWLVATSPWVLLALLAASALVGITAVARWGSTPSPGRLHLRIALQMAGITAVIYATGWGPLLFVGYLYGGADNLRASGSRAAWPAIIWFVLTMTAGQTAIALGLAPTFIDLPAAHGVAALAALGTVFVIQLIGSATARSEQAQAAVRASEAQYRRLFENNPHSTWVYDLETLAFLAVNDAAVAHYGYSRDEFLRMIITDIRPSEDVPALLDNLSRASAPFERSGTWRHRRKDGTIIDVDVRSHAVLFDGRPARLVFAEDLTGRRVKERAEQANLAKTEFLSRMSHELRTPLNAILGFAQLLEMDALTSEQREHLGHILRGGRYLLDLINEVLDIGRIESGHLALTPEPIPLHDIVGECLDLIAPLAARRSIRLQEPGPAAVLCHVLGDRQRLKQVILNLLSNAVKFNRKGGSVALSWAETSPGRVRIEIRDTGIGIPPEMIDRLFTPFERLGAERAEIEGTGIGLAVSKRLVELMGGAIGVESQAGRGSTFWIEFPLVEAPAQGHLQPARGG